MFSNIDISVVDHTGETIEQFGNPDLSPGSGGYGLLELIKDIDTASDLTNKSLLVLQWDLALESGDSYRWIGSGTDSFYGICLDTACGSAGSVGDIIEGDITTSVVPLPAAVWLFGSAILGLGVLKRKKA